MTNDNLSAALEYAEKNLDKSLETLFGALRIKSISSEKEYTKDCIAAGQYFVDMLNDLGFDASLRDGLGLPLVVAHGGEGERHIMFYGHYDVQPVDPLELWRRDPFEPVIEEINGEKIIFGRGSSDDKGQIMTFIEACRAIIATNGKLPCRVTILLEGEEESDSISLLPFMRENKEELAAECAFICDTERWNIDTPAITIGLRGNVTGEVKIIAANRDLHSGIYGGPAANPIMILSTALSKMRDENGHITLEGFYDGAPIITDQIRKNWASLGFDEQKFLGDIGLSVPYGEKGLTILEQLWARPTAEICGINGGYTGKGFKTVIASEAFAKVSFRLVGTQDPDKIWAAFEKHILAHLPSDCRAEFKMNKGSAGVALDANDPIIANAAKALEEEWGKPAALIGCGASIPVAKEIPEILGMNAILIGFAMSDDNIHSPNEKYDLSAFTKGIRSWIRVLSKF